MTRSKFLASLAGLFLVGINVQQLIAACACMCAAVSGVPAQVDVDTSGTTCEKAFEFTYSVHFGTNNDCAGSGVPVIALAYPDSGAFSENIQNEDMTPAQFTVDGEGHTEEMTVSGELRTESKCGLVASLVYSMAGGCNTTRQDVVVLCDEDCENCDLETSENCP